MIVQLAKELSKVDEDLSLVVRVSKDNIYSLEVVSDDLGDMYSYSSTDLFECGDKIRHYIDCLKDPELFFDLVEKVFEEPLEV